MCLQHDYSSTKIKLINRHLRIRRLLSVYLYDRTDMSAVQKEESSISKSGCDTVGAVAMDCHGNLAFANTTGGITGKMPGRVGDSPIVGKCKGRRGQLGGLMPL